MSVDPLVSMTGEPYIYGSANPVRYSDPSGLCTDPGCWDFLGPVAREMAGIDPSGSAAEYQREYNGFVGDAMNDRGASKWTPAERLYYQQLNPFHGPNYQLPQADITWRSFVGVGKNLVVGGVAVFAGGSFCLATGGLGCVVLVGAAAGAGTNIILSEVEDCIQGASCGEISARELAGDAVDGALVGTASGVSGRGLALALGSDKAAVGVIGSAVSRTSGLVATLDAVVSTGGVRIYVSGVRASADATLRYIHGTLHAR